MYACLKNYIHVFLIKLNKQFRGRIEKKDTTELGLSDRIVFWCHTNRMIRYWAKILERSMRFDLVNNYILINPIWGTLLLFSCGKTIARSIGIGKTIYIGKQNDFPALDKIWYNFNFYFWRSNPMWFEFSLTETIRIGSSDPRWFLFSVCKYIFQL
jgi:hypothetical protein